MKLRNLFLGVCSAVAVFAACEQAEQNLGNPEISISVSEMTFDVDGGDQALTVTSTRDWKVENDADWVVVSPSSGEASADPQTVTVSVLPNNGLDRSADLVFTIGLKKKYLTVTQAGPGGSAEALIVYSNNFDVTKAVQGTSGWPYLDANYDLWDNKKGTGSETVEYEFGGKMSVRTSGKASNDGSGYSHYAGSGTNKVFFGAATSILKINKITLNGTQTDFALSFGGQKYLQGSDSNFSWNEFKVYVSNDMQKWVELAMAFPADADIDGDWNLASCNFTVPAGTTQLGLAFVATASSAYSIDDVLLQNGEAGQVIDFSTGTAISGTTGGNTGSGDSGSGDSGSGSGSTTEQPTNLVKATIAQFLAAAEDDTWYELTGEIVSIEKQDYGNFTIKDEAGDEIYIYGMTNGWVGSNNKSFSQIGLKVTDVVTLGTKRTSYNGTPQGGGNPVPAYYISHVAGEGVPVTPTAGSYVKVTAEQADWTGKYLIVWGTSAHATLASSAKDLNATVTGLSITDGVITANSELDAAAMTVTKNGEAYAMTFSNGKYFGMQKNGCKLFDTAFDLNFEYTTSGVKISGYVAAESNTFYLYENASNASSGTYYRCYVEKNQNGYTFPQLYKYIAE